MTTRENDAFAPPGRSKDRLEQELTNLFMKVTLKPMVLRLAVASLLFASALAAEPAQTNAASAALSSTPSGDTILAKGKGVEIRRSQLDKEVMSVKAQVAAEGRTFKPEQNIQVERQVLEQLINIKLLEAKATAADKAVGKAAAEKRLVAAQANVGSEEAFDAELKRLGTTREVLLVKWIQALTGEAVLKREFKISITDQEVRKFYDENPTQFDAPEAVRASHILLTTVDAKSGAPIPDDQKAAKRQSAEAVLKRARGGEDFAKLAREFSDDPVSKARGGEYTISHGQMVPEVEAAAFAMTTNQIGDIVTSSYGYHIIKVSEKIPAHRIEFAKAAPDIRNMLTQKAIGQQFPAYIARLRTEAGVEILDEKLNPQGSLSEVAPRNPRPRPRQSPPAK
jgi:parvulin-like peptidyl-prolyl isomerase